MAAVDKGQDAPRIILVGSPNVGKSSLFNELTGTYTTVSNYPGTSVEISRGHCDIAGTRYEVLDTPGMYSLIPISEEEKVARDILLNETPHVVIHVIDARNVERMLPMTLQLIEAGLPMMLVINIMDEAERLGIQIDFPALRERLGIPVIGAATARRRGLQEIRQAIDNQEFGVGAPFSYSPDLEDDIHEISACFQSDYRLSRRSLALLLLQKDTHIQALVGDREGELAEPLMECVKKVSFARRSDLHLSLIHI